MKYDPGDVIFGDDPFNDREAPRPWLVVSDETHPFYGDQYIAVTLTTKSWHDHTITLTDDNWEHGGMPRESAVVPWGIASPDHDDLNHERYQGTLTSTMVKQIASEITGYLLTP